MYPILVIITLFTSVMLLNSGCNPRGAVEPAGTKQEPISETLLSSNLTPGLSRAAVVSKFGKPDLHRVKTNGMVLDEYFLPADRETSWSNRVDGFQVMYDGDRVVDWKPVYSWRSVAPRSGAIKTAEAGSINFLVLGDSESNPPAGVAGALTVRSIKSVHPVTNDHIHSITFELTGENVEPFRLLTKTNIGKQLIIQFGDEPVAAMVIQMPIENGQVKIANIPQEKISILESALSSLVR